MKKKDYRETLGTFQIHMKEGKEKFLNEVAKWYEAMYPARADFFRQNLRQLREINKNSDGSYKDAKGREWFVRYRVPKELLMFVQRWVPDFGQDSADIDLLVRVWCDLVRPGKDRRKHTRLVVKEDYVAKSRPNRSSSRCPCCKEAGSSVGPDDPDLCDDHRKELRGESRQDAAVAADVPLAD